METFLSFEQQVRLKFDTNLLHNHIHTVLMIKPTLSPFADLNKEFEVPPYSQSVQLGSQVEMRCHPPRGQPSPDIRWLKDRQELDMADPNYLAAADGHLIIIQVRAEDVANYSCVAENLVNRRVSPPARLEIVGGCWSVAAVRCCPKLCNLPCCGL